MEPSLDSLNISILAANDSFPDTSLIARCLTEGTAFCIISQECITPGTVEPFLILPTSMIFCDGIFARVLRPPACVISRAARALPIMALTFGASSAIRLSRYTSI
ncbi:uncharacterized protein BXIN_2825 [Babesia sp. Xinjiang]|uniref:uncharacterized protein n=1 Tax=Babesia sp. Xinjiang TaxID=462227 RepID=UPI000A23AFC3|nr:uncharacterized protein BXIN_2825 [Babesia sp. Xinjiang]ORM41751.1 hypothetical protein BXIN_2825 [Babesia sp. Xinjiang]